VIGGPDEIVKVIRAYGDLGAEEVILNLSLDPFGGFDRAYPKRLAPVVEALR
jgi:hypothetical protein